MCIRDRGGVDLNQRCIHVRQTLTVRNELKPPKSKAGIRTVNIDTATAKHLEYWKARQAVELSKIGVHQDDTTPVCCSNTGSYFNLDNFERWWRPWRKEHGFIDLLFHELRHTQATNLLANGVDVKTVQTRMGHEMCIRDRYISAARECAKPEPQAGRLSTSDSWEVVEDEAA